MLGEAVCAGALLSYSLAVHVTWGSCWCLATEYATTVSLGGSDGRKRLAAGAEDMQANVRRLGVQLRVPCGRKGDGGGVADGG